MFLTVPATRDIYSGHFGTGVKEVVTPARLPRMNGNGFGLSGWFDGVDWGGIIETGAKTGAAIATAQWGQPKLTAGQSIQRVKNADGSYSEVLTQQTPGVPIGLGISSATAAAGGIGIGTLAMLGLGVAVVFMMQGRR